MASGTDVNKNRPGLGELPVNVPRWQADPGVRREAPFDIRRRGEAHIDAEEEEENDNSDTQTVTDTTTSGDADTDRIPPPKLTKAEIRALKKAAKVAKSQSKAFKNQRRHIISVRTSDVDFVATILHGDSASQASNTHPLASDKTVEEVIARNMGFMSSIQEHKKLLLSGIAARRRSEREAGRRKSNAPGASWNAGGKKRRFSEGFGGDWDDEDEEMEDLLAAVLAKLGIDAVHIRSGGAGSTPNGHGQGNAGGGAKKSHGHGANGDRPHGSTSTNVVALVANLKALVRDDLERHENEQRETCVRAGGFWRYVGRPVFERMTEIARELDWKTGMKLKEREG